MLDVQLKQSNFMTSVENVNKFVFKCVETEHLQVKLTMIVCLEQAYEMFTSSQTSVHSDSAFRKLAGTTLISSCPPEPGTQNLLASDICFNFYCKLRLI